MSPWTVHFLLTSEMTCWAGHYLLGTVTLNNDFSPVLVTAAFPALRAGQVSNGHTHRAPGSPGEGPEPPTEAGRGGGQKSTLWLVSAHGLTVSFLCPSLCPTSSWKSPASSAVLRDPEEEGGPAASESKGQLESQDEGCFLHRPERPPSLAVTPLPRALFSRRAPPRPAEPSVFKEPCQLSVPRTPTSPSGSK